MLLVSKNKFSGCVFVTEWIGQSQSSPWVIIRGWWHIPDRLGSTEMRTVCMGWSSGINGYLTASFLIRLLDLRFWLDLETHLIHVSECEILLRIPWYWEIFCAKDRWICRGHYWVRVFVLTYLGRIYDWIKECVISSFNLTSLQSRPFIFYLAHIRVLGT